MASSNISWAETKRTLYFPDIPTNTPFRNIGPRSQGAIYIKVEHQTVHRSFGEDGTCIYDGDVVFVKSNFYMMEVATGKLWPPTESPIEVVDLKIEIGVPKPEIYR